MTIGHYLYDIPLYPKCINLNINAYYIKKHILYNIEKNTALNLIKQHQ